MPEGDTIHGLARRLRPTMLGSRLRRVWIRDGGARRLGGKVQAVHAIGKHLVIVTGTGWALRTHLGMVGAWDLDLPGAPLRKGRSRVRVLLEGAAWRAVCFDPPDVAVFSWARRREHLPLARLGPDLCTQPDFDEVLARARAWRGEHFELGELLLAQGVACGLGNVYKSELPFLTGLSPFAPPDSVDDEALLDLYREGSRLLKANLGAGPRVTAPRHVQGPRRGSGLWVYGRHRLPCRRCGSPVLSRLQGRDGRPTWWCARCQPGQPPPVLGTPR